MKHGPTSTLFLILTGLVLSIAALFASDPICDTVQQQRLKKAGRNHAAEVVKTLEDKLAKVQEFANAFMSTDMSAREFDRLAANVLTTRGVHSIEWAPQVQPEDRAAFQQQLQQQHDRPIEITIFRYGRRRPIPLDVPCYPIVRVAPRGPNFAESIGYQRNRVRDDLSNRCGEPMLTPKAVFYPEDKPRRGVFLGAKSPDGKTSGLVFASFKNLFNDEQLQLPGTHIALAEPKNMQQPADQAAYSALTTTVATPNLYRARKRIAGRVFEFTVKEKPGAGFRPIWFPWTLFFLCNAIVCVLGLTYHQRNSERLRSHNEELQQEVERRIAANRQLQATLDFRDQEREIVAHDIHDGFVQDVIGAQMYIESLLAASDGPHKEKAQTAAELLGRAISEARRTIDYLKPKVVDEVGLVAAIQTSIADDVDKFDFNTEFLYASDFPRLPLLVERMVYSMVREGISNARKHSGSDSARVFLGVNDGEVIVEVIDDGNGFDVGNLPSNAFGVLGIHHRAGVLNGKVTIKSSEFGTKVQITIPLNTNVQPLPTNDGLVLLP